jgi:hypothetical protein
VPRSVSPLRCSYASAVEKAGPITLAESSLAWGGKPGWVDISDAVPPLEGDINGTASGYYRGSELNACDRNGGFDGRQIDRAVHLRRQPQHELPFPPRHARIKPSSRDQLPKAVNFGGRFFQLIGGLSKTPASSGAVG